MPADIQAKATTGVAPAGDMSPGEHLRAEIGRLALDQVAVGKAAGVSRQSINNIINGRQPISRAMAIKLGRLTGHSSDYWLRASFPVPAGATQANAGGGNGAGAVQSGVLVSHEIARAIRLGIIGINPFSADHLRAASIDLTLDDVVTDGDRRIDIRGMKGFLLRSGRSITAGTKEAIDLPRDHVGRVGALQRIVGAGILVSHLFQLEPGFSGPLQLCLFNAGAQPFRLRAGEPVIGLEIARLDATRPRQA